MKPKPISILLSILLLAVISPAVTSVSVAASGVNVWTSTTSYPTTIAGESCVVSGGYVYCVGGSSAVYFAKLSSSGIGVWISTTSYPTTIYEQSCIVSGGDIYCVGGTPNGFAATSTVYFASLSSSGVGSWKNTTNYPTTIVYPSCVASGGYAYCVGGYTGSVTTSAVYFAKLSSSGIGAWKKTTGYPTTIYEQSCVVNGVGVYCVGGTTNGSIIISAVYFAKLSSSGVGLWKKTTSYLTTIVGESCVVSGGYVYCVGGYPFTSAVYFAKSSSAGVGMWTSTTSYPTTIYPQNGQSCVVSGVDIYCVGGDIGGIGYTSAVYFASV